MNTKQKFLKISLLATLGLASLSFFSCEKKEEKPKQPETVKVTLNYVRGEQSYWKIALETASEGAVIEFVDAKTVNFGMNKDDVTLLINKMVSKQLKAKEGTVIWMNPGLIVLLSQTDINNLDRLGIRLLNPDTQELVPVTNNG